ncbi:MAG: aminotransferase class I/II-fold pyridoxal phosphate-dependent enzyme [Pirellulales bacterium]|nr:aminotransferase class I/II-fold pyridoxal phosphate-dependent enzyme [Pirellulales bacterium]
MPDRPEDICPRLDLVPPQPTQPLVPPIYPAVVYRCADPQQAATLLAGDEEGYIYSRDGQPNADLLAAKCRELHGADRAVICSSGMAALATVLLSGLTQGDHVVVSDKLYGRSGNLFTGEAGRFGIDSTVVDVTDLPAVAAACTERTRVILAESISNPLLRVADVKALAEIAHRRGARLLIDNTFASPIACRPLALGADLVMESLTKIINGHSDVMLGLLCGCEAAWDRVPHVVTTWGFAAAPFDCWLAARGLSTLALRAAQAGENAARVAAHLAGDRRVAQVLYPGLSSHADHVLAQRQFEGRYGAMVTIVVPDGSEGATRFIRAARRIPFSPSLGDLATTLSHPESTSHRGLSPDERRAAGIDGGMLRLSIGIESADSILDAIEEGLAAL